MRRPDWYLKQLRERVSIADYAGKRLTWDRRKSRPSAGDYWAPCPFHTEKSASFHVRDREGTFKCFGCGEGGDVFKLCQKLEGLDFVGAIDRLALEAGMPPPETTPGEQRAQDARGRLLRIVAAAHGLYRKALMAPEHASVRAYLENRGLGPDAWDQFGIGYAPDQWTFALDALGREGVRREDVIAAGLAREGGRSGAIDLFRHRVMFPIADAQGRVIAFGGRTLSTDKETPKYVNSPDSDVYHKGKVLYRLKEAREVLARTRGDGFVVAEGYLDVAAFERAGVAAVAPLGTALTDDQLLLAWKSGGAPTLCFDGDAAGLRAADRALDTALPHLGPERTVRIVILPPGLDPDDVFRASGPDALTALLKTALPADEALFQREKARRPLDTPEARADLQRRLKEAAARIAHPDTRRQYERALNDRFYALTRPAARAPFAPPSGARGPRGRAAEPPAHPTPELKTLAQLQNSSLMESMVRLPVDHPHVLRAGADRFAHLPIADRDLDKIRHAILDLWAASKPVDRAALSHHLLSAGLESAAGAVLRWPPPVAARRRDGAADAAATGGEAAVVDGTGPEALGGDAQRVEAEWMAFLSLDLTSPQVVKEIDEARRADLDTDDEAYRAAIAATKARRALYEAAVNRGDPNDDAGPARPARPGELPQDRVA
ncbi:MAG: DNA primase [Hyphomonadaceae bacterium]|nr:DNA primase [Hyphomonadaceae bacterium]